MANKAIETGQFTWDLEPDGRLVQPFGMIDPDFYSRLWRLLSEYRSGTFLDVGSGSDPIPILCKALYASKLYLVTERHTDALRNLVAHFSEHIHLVSNDAASMPRIPSGSVDLAFCLGLMGGARTPPPDDIWREISRVVHPRGAVLISTGMRADTPDLCDQWAGEARKFFDSVEVHSPEVILDPSIVDRSRFQLILRRPDHSRGGSSS